MHLKLEIAPTLDVTLNGGRLHSPLLLRMLTLGLIGVAVVLPSAAEADGKGKVVRLPYALNGTTLTRSFNHKDYQGHYWSVVIKARFGYVSNKYIRLDAVTTYYWIWHTNVPFLRTFELK